MKKRAIAISLGFLMLALMLSGCGILGEEPEPAVEPEPEQEAASEPEPGEPEQEAALEPEQEPAPGAIFFPVEFEATDLYGNAVTDVSLGEKDIFFVHLWATWCPPCIDEMPDFPELIETYGDRVAFFALLEDYGTNLSGAVDIVESAGIPSSFVMVDAYEPSVSGLLGLLNSGYVPTTVLITARGVSQQFVGSYGMGYAPILDELLG